MIGSIWIWSDADVAVFDERGQHVKIEGWSVWEALIVALAYQGGLRRRPSE